VIIGCCFIPADIGYSGVAGLRGFRVLAQHATSRTPRDLLAFSRRLGNFGLVLGELFKPTRRCGADGPGHICNGDVSVGFGDDSRSFRRSSEIVTV